MCCFLNQDDGQDRNGAIPGHTEPNARKACRAAAQLACEPRMLHTTCEIIIDVRQHLLRFSRLHTVLKL